MSNDPTRGKWSLPFAADDEAKRIAEFEAENMRLRLALENIIRTAQLKFIDCVRDEYGEGYANGRSDLRIDVVKIARDALKDGDA